MSYHQTFPEKPAYPHGLTGNEKTIFIKLLTIMKTNKLKKMGFHGSPAGKNSKPK
jgi:hypothetical protein